MTFEVKDKLHYGYLITALRYLAKKKCNKKNCGTVCLCEPCCARAVLPESERR